MKCLKTAALLMALMIMSLTAPGAAAETPELTGLYKQKDIEEAWNEAEAEAIDLNTLSGSTLELTGAGPYVLSGSWQGQLVIRAAETEKVRLILSGASIVSGEGPAILEAQADKLILTLAAGTENSLTGGTEQTLGDETCAAALYAQDDLSINGSGTLVVNGGAKHGIHCKADLIIAGGNLRISAAADGVRGRSSVLVLGGVMDITAGGDGIAATRDDRADKGWVVVAGGSVTIRTGDGAGEISVSSQNRGRGRDWTAQQDTGSETSQKGIKAAADLTIMGGSLYLDCADDALHAANITVSGGTMNIASGDDALHADADVRISGGTLVVSRCYEGIEGMNVTISDGYVQVSASDDAINAAGGSDGSGFGGRGGWGGFREESAASAMLTISGGWVQANAGGDALDSNGSISITGGVTGIRAASSMGEGAIDFNGTGSITGGLVIIAGTGGVMSDTARVSGERLIGISLSTARPGGTVITVAADGGDTLGVFDCAGAFDTLTIAGENLAEGSFITVYADSDVLFSGEITADMLLAADDRGGWGEGHGGGRHGRPGW